MTPPFARPPAAERAGKKKLPLHGFLRLVLLSGACALPAAFIIISASCATPPPSPPANIAPGDFTYAGRYLDWLVRRDMARADIPGCAVAVVSREGVLFQRAYGVAGRSTREPVTTKTFFRAGSITKSLTALAVMKLSEEGLVDLDAPLARYVPGFSIKSRFPGASPVTVRELLAHRSGITGDYLSGIMGDRRLTSPELVAALADEYLCFPPGEVFYYSNTGYSLLGALIERVTGRRLEEYVKTEILDPIGMRESALELTPEIEPLLAKGHMPKALGFFPGGQKGTAEVPYLPIRDAAAGALLTNIEELGRYAQFLLAADCKLDPPIVNAQDYFEMTRLQFPGNNASVFEAADYGLGFMLDAFLYPDVRDLVHHSGNVNGFYSFIVFSRSRDLGLVLLCNSASGFFSCYDLVSRGFRKYLDAATPAPLRASAPPGYAGPGPSAAAPEPAPLAALTGRYAVLGVPVDVQLRGNKLWLVFPPAKFDLRLTREKGNRFSVAAMVLGLFPVDPAPFMGLDKAAVDFDPATTGAPTMYLEGTAGEAVIRLALRKAEKTAIPSSFERYLGNYVLERDERNAESLDLYLPVKELKLEKKNGWLTLSSPDLGPDLGLAMTPVGNDQALLLGTNETVFFSGDELRFSGLRARKK